MSAQGKGPRKWAYGSSTIMGTVVFVGIVVFVALISERHFRRFDFSEGGVFSLSEQTRKILDTVNQPVTVKAFFATGAPDEPRARDLLDTFRYHNPNIQVEFIDPDRNPEVAKKYEVRTYGTLVLEGFGRKQSIQTADEQNMANALLKLTRSEQKKIYFVTGHGQRSLNDADREGYSTVRAALQKENHVVEELNLVQQAQVPEDAAVVIVAGPRKNLFEQEIASLEAYLKRGGRLAVLLDPHHDAGLKDFLKRYGVDLGDNIVIDKLSRVFGGSYLMPVVTDDLLSRSPKRRCRQGASARGPRGGSGFHFGQCVGGDGFRHAGPGSGEPGSGTGPAGSGSHSRHRRDRSVGHPGPGRERGGSPGR